MQTVIHVGEESDDVVGQRNGVVVAVVSGVLQHHFGQIGREGNVGVVQKRVDLAIKIVETWQTEQLKALLTEWKKDHPAELKAA